MRMITSQMSRTFPGPSAGRGKLGLKKCFGEKTVFFSSCGVHCISEVHNHRPSIGSTQQPSVIGACSRERSTLLVELTGCMTDQSPTNERREPPRQTCSLVLEKAPSPSRHILSLLDLDELQQAFHTLQVQELGWGKDAESGHLT